MDNKGKKIISAILAGTFMFSGTTALAPYCGVPSVVCAADIDIEDFSLSDITMLDSYCVNGFSKEIEYLLSFDNSRLP